MNGDAMATVTHTRTHTGRKPANPYLACTSCGERVTGYHDGDCECGETLHRNLPCWCWAGDYSRCGTWSPVDGCTCKAGHAAHR